MLETKNENKPNPRHITWNVRTLATKENPNDERGKSHTEESECSPTLPATLELKDNEALVLKYLRKIISNYF